MDALPTILIIIATLISFLGLLLITLFGIVAAISGTETDIKEYLPLDGEEIEHKDTSRNRR